MSRSSGGVAVLRSAASTSRSSRVSSCLREVARDARERGEIAETEAGNPDRAERIDANRARVGASESGLRYLAARAPNRDFAVVVDAADVRSSTCDRAPW